MNIYEKLQEARVELQGMNLKKSGKNSFAQYDYFELADFMIGTTPWPKPWHRLSRTVLQRSSLRISLVPTIT